MNFFDSTLIYPIFDVESIGDVPRVPRTHLDVVFSQTIHVYYSTPVPLLSPLTSPACEELFLAAYDPDGQWCTLRRLVQLDNLNRFCGRVVL